MGGERECGQPARDELVRVLAERDVLCAVADESSEARAHRCGLDGRSLPLIVHELCGIEPGALLRVEPDVRPRLVRVACEQKPLTDSKSRVVPREGILCQSSVSSPRSPVLGLQSSVSSPQSTVLFSRIPNPESRIPNPESRAPVLLSPSTQEAS